MAKQAKKAAKKTAEEKPAADSLIKTVSEVAAMDDKEKQAFREAGGTTVQD